MTEITPTQLTPEERKVLWRPTTALHVFSDVTSQWRDGNGIPKDFDEGLTTSYRHLFFGGLSTEDGIDPKDSVRGAYGVELIACLVDGARDEIIKALQNQEIEINPQTLEVPRDQLRKVRENIHPDIERARRALKSGAVRLIANLAIRSDETKATNGPDFHLALLDNGVEVYAAPLKRLEFVRERIRSLFRIPTLGHPVFRGDREQFRSSVIARSCQFPEHLVRVGDPTEVIPEQKEPLQVAYVDKFGNLRLRCAKAAQDFLREKVQGRSTCIVKVGDVTLSDVRLGSCLNDLDENEWGLYCNSAELSSNDGGSDGGWPTHYLELIWKNYEATESGGSWAALGKPELGASVTVEIQ